MGDSLRAVTSNGRRSFVVTGEGRIDAVLSSTDGALTRAGAQKLIAEGLVSVNGEIVRKSARVVAGDEVAYELPEARDTTRTVDFDLPVLFEDAFVVAIDKPAGIAVHPALGDDAATVADWFVKRYQPPGVFPGDYPGIVHRLDRDTSGVLLLARTPEAQTALSSAFEQRTVHKTYLAVTAATPRRERAVIDAPIGRHPADRTRMTVTRSGRDARTSYEVLGTDGERCLVLAQPETGRTHQIRVHLAAVGAPVLGDRIYGRGSAERQLLHAWRIDIPHPDGGRLEATAPLPDDMIEAVRSMGLETVASPYIDNENHAARRIQD